MWCGMCVMLRECDMGEMCVMWSDVIWVRCVWCGMSVVCGVGCV